MEAIGTAATALVRSMGSQAPSDELSKRPERPISGEPTTMDECRALAAWADALPLEPPTLASDNYILNRLAFMQATLPARTVDEDAGEKRTAVYLAILRGHSRGAMEYLADRACRELAWFPTPKDCLAIAGQYRAPESERAATLRLCERFSQDAFAQWLDIVRDGQDLGDVPEQWLRIAVERGEVRRLEDGAYVSRAQYQGPSIKVTA